MHRAGTLVQAPRPRLAERATFLPLRTVVWRHTPSEWRVVIVGARERDRQIEGRSPGLA
jgi:hypothetical protein